MFDQALGFFNHHFGHLNVTRRRLVERRGDDLALHRALHVGNFFRTLVDEQHNQHNLRMVGGDGVGNILQDHGLARARR